MLVYIHVPFCRTRCNYCAFYSMPLGRGVSAGQSPAVRDYVDSLFLEMRSKLIQLISAGENDPQLRRKLSFPFATVNRASAFQADSSIQDVLDISVPS